MKQYMVVERFKDHCWEAAYARFHTSGRLLPDGLKYIQSWPNKDQNVCFQLMETDDVELFDLWFARWNDLVDFTLVPVDAKDVNS